MSDPVYEYLNNRISGLQGAVVALMTHLVQKDVTSQESLVLALDGFAILADLKGDQLEVLESVKRTLLGHGVWIPQVIEGGKSGNPDPETD